MCMVSDKYSEGGVVWGPGVDLDSMSPRINAGPNPSQKSGSLQYWLLIQVRVKSCCGYKIQEGPPS